MISLLVRLGLALLVLNVLITPADALWHRNNQGGDYGRGTKISSKDQPRTLLGNSAGLPSQNATRRGLGVSAWGIVFIILALILAGMGFYYFSVCYPVCQPTKGKYDKMAMPSMV